MLLCSILLVVLCSTVLVMLFSTAVVVLRSTAVCAFEVAKRDVIVVHCHRPSLFCEHVCHTCKVAVVPISLTFRTSTI